jgi:hypothetical protein
VNATPRYLWQLLEPLHAVLYFAPETKQAAAGLGLDGKGMAYVAFRAAPLGRVGAATVTAVFHGFHPRLISGAVPAAWERAHPEEVLGARLSVVDRVLARLVPEAARSTGRLAELLGEVVAEADVAGRPLAAANRDLTTPTEPTLAVWHAATVLREHRGDGHVAALVGAQLGPCAAHVLRAATGAWAAETLRTTRGWSPEEWAAAADELRDRGWLSSAGGLTTTAWREVRAYERLTDELAAGPWRRLGARRLAEVVSLLEPLCAAVVDAGGVPVGDGLGSPWPSVPGAEAMSLSAP